MTVVDSERAIEFLVGESRWRCELSDYSCKKTGPAFPVPSGRQVMLARTMQPIGVTAPPPSPEQPKLSPDEKWEAMIRNYNVFIRAKGAKDWLALSFDGSEGNYYAAYSLTWSPDSSRLAAYRIRTGYHRKIDYVQSSPADQLQDRKSTRLNSSHIQKSRMPSSA